MSIEKSLNNNQFTGWWKWLKNGSFYQKNTL